MKKPTVWQVLIQSVSHRQYYWRVLRISIVHRTIAQGYAPTYTEAAEKAHQYLVMAQDFDANHFMQLKGLEAL